MSDTISSTGQKQERAHARPRRAALGIAVVVLGLAASVAACLFVRRLEDTRLRVDFQQRAQLAALEVTDGLQRHQDALFALRTLFHFAPEVTDEAFASAARELMQRQTGVRALEWVERVPGAGRGAFEARRRAAGAADFEIRERVSGNTLRRAPEREEYFPVAMIEPLAGNEPALGFDLRSGITWPSMEKIAAVDRISASGRLPLITTGAGPDWGYIMELPVYARPGTARTPEERRAQLRGFVLGIFHIAQTLEALFAQRGEDSLEVLFLDRSATRPEQELLYFQSRGRSGRDPAAAPGAAEFAAALHLRVPFDHAGRQWELWFRPDPAWARGHSQRGSWLALALGLAMTGFAGFYIFGAIQRERVVGRLVDERTAELRATQAELEADVRRRREAERQLSNVVSHLPGAVFRCNFDARLTAQFASDGMAQLTGYTAEDFVSGRIAIGELTLAEDRRRVRRGLTQCVRARSGFEFEVRIRDRADRLRWLLVRGRPVFADDGALRFLEGLAIDVTPLKAAEAEKLSFERKLLETQRLESLGVLAGGVAHDFNNLLTAMLGNATLAREALPPGGAGAEHLRHIEEAARRAADLCQQMLAYAGRNELRAQRLDVGELVRSTTALLRVSIRRNTRLELQLGEHLPAVRADPAQLQQIVMNLVINAADAIGERPGRIVVATFRREADAAFLRTALLGPELPPGTYVGLEVRDDGCGMTPDTLARIFEPFFTTKFSGRGLGLAAVLGIVQSHRGALFVETAPGRGSTFRLLLQALPEAAAAPAPPAAEAPPLRGTVLVIDDEDFVRDVLGATLRRSGMSPLLAASGEAGLQLYAAQGNRVDVVLLDLTMPGWSGEDTLRALRAVNREQRVIVMSGYSDGDTRERCARLGVSGFIAKPFELPVLLKILREVTN